MSDPNDNSIPVLHEVLVPGDPAQARHAAATQPAPEPGTPREPGFAVEPALAPEPAHAAEPAFAREPAHAAEPAHHPEHAHPRKRTRAHHALDPLHEHEAALAASPGVFDRTEPPAPLEAGATVPPDIAREPAVEPQADLDADAIVERLRGRFAGFLSGEGRGIIEARCRDALQDHTAWLVNQITREVALSLESEMSGWVRDAVEEEMARRSGSA
ncbi:MAG TPA: DUF2486 family protein [Paraburkholderia sp.]|nr:DUF2486 family protein [Paraburkholderia sp.]